MTGSRGVKFVKAAYRSRIQCGPRVAIRLDMRNITAFNVPADRFLASPSVKTGDPTDGVAASPKTCIVPGCVHAPSKIVRLRPNQYLLLGAGRLPKRLTRLQIAADVRRGAIAVHLGKEARALGVPGHQLQRTRRCTIFEIDATLLGVAHRCVVEAGLPVSRRASALLLGASGDDCRTAKPRKANSHGI
jgi:hypothetical protein